MENVVFGCSVPGSIEAQKLPPIELLILDKYVGHLQLREIGKNLSNTHQGLQ